MATGSPGPPERRRKLFRRFGLPEQTERLYPFQLSGGMARRVLVSTALLTSARLIIADEPTPGMSLEQAEEALAMFRAMADEGKGVVLITHDIDLAFHIADRIAVFTRGPQWKPLRRQTFARGRRPCGIPTARPSGGLCPSMSSGPSRASNPMREICPVAASSPPAAPAGRRNVRSRSHLCRRCGRER